MTRGKEIEDLSRLIETIRNKTCLHISDENLAIQLLDSGYKKEPKSNVNSGLAYDDLVEELWKHMVYKDEARTIATLIMEDKERIFRPSLDEIQKPREHGEIKYVKLVIELLKRAGYSV